MICLDSPRVFCGGKVFNYFVFCVCFGLFFHIFLLTLVVVVVFKHSLIKCFKVFHLCHFCYSPGSLSVFR